MQEEKPFSPSADTSGGVGGGGGGRVRYTLREVGGGVEKGGGVSSSLQGGLNLQLILFYFRSYLRNKSQVKRTNDA
jgi:hypothetical protein